VRFERTKDSRSLNLEEEVESQAKVNSFKSREAMVHLVHGGSDGTFGQPHSISAIVRLIFWMVVSLDQVILTSYF